MTKIKTTAFLNRTNGLKTLQDRRMNETVTGKDGSAVLGQ